jgi:hypothetical protein
MRADVHAAGGRGADGVEQFLEGGRLGDVSGRPRLEHPRRPSLVDVAAEGHHPDAGRLVHDLPRRLDAVQPRHLDVHEDDVRPQLRRQGHRLAAVGGVGNDGQAGRLVDQAPQAVADERVVVPDEDPDDTDRSTSRTLGSAHRALRPPPVCDMV